jgi:hypothetical protein
MVWFGQGVEKLESDGPSERLPTARTARAPIFHDPVRQTPATDSNNHIAVSKVPRITTMSSYSSADEAYDSDEPPEFELELGKLMGRVSDVLKVKCIGAKKLTRGASHEIFTLQFQETPTAPESLAQAGFCCIARFTRGNCDTAKSTGEIATARYLRRFTEIPVPEIYYYDLDPDNDIGAPFVLMERMPGRHLHKIWDNLPLEGKKSALSQIAWVIAQFASLKFEQIGEEIDRLLALNDHATYLQSPFCLIHADFDGQNMLFLESPGESGLKLVGLIDFEYAYTGPLYFLYEYPIFIQDVSWSKDLYAENTILRAHFVRAIYEALLTAEARATLIASMNEKSFSLSGFRDSFMAFKCSEKTLINSTTFYLQSLEDGTGPAYSGRLDYIPELYTEEADLQPPNTTGNKEIKM